MSDNPPMVTRVTADIKRDKPIDAFEGQVISLIDRFKRTHGANPMLVLAGRRMYANLDRARRPEDGHHIFVLGVSVLEDMDRRPLSMAAVGLNNGLPWAIVCEDIE